VVTPGPTPNPGGSLPGSHGSKGPTISVQVARSQRRPFLKVFNGDGSPRFSFFPFAKRYRGGVHFAIADVNGDGFPDIVVVSTSNPVQKVRVFDGSTGNLLRQINGGARSSTANMHVAAGDINGDGRADIVIGAGPQMVVFDGASGQKLFRSKPFGKRPVRVAMADLKGTGVDEVVALARNGALMKAYDGHTFQQLPAGVIIMPLGQILALVGQ
jgi:hypothetical protein